jgi:surface antigen
MTTAPSVRPSTVRRRSRAGRFVVSALLAAALGLPATVSADPPPWAPAHGWRKQHDPSYVGFTGHKWEHDYGILDGTCNREAIGAVLGGVLGGAIGSTVGEGNTRVVAIIAGTAIGAVVGGQVGKTLDDADRACMGHALELVAENRSVTWTNPHSGVNYRVTPGGSPGQGCREFTTRKAVRGARTEIIHNVACRGSDGTWRIQA